MPNHLIPAASSISPLTTPATSFTYAPINLQGQIWVRRQVREPSPAVSPAVVAPMPNTLYFRALNTVLKTGHSDEVTAALRLALPAAGIQPAEFRNHVLKTLAGRSDPAQRECLLAAFELFNLPPADLVGAPPAAVPFVPTVLDQNDAGYEKSRFKEFVSAPLPGELARADARSVPHEPMTPAKLLGEALAAKDGALASAAVQIDPLAVTQTAFIAMLSRMPEAARLALCANTDLAANLTPNRFQTLMLEQVTKGAAYTPRRDISYRTPEALATAFPAFAEQIARSTNDDGARGVAAMLERMAPVQLHPLNVSTVARNAPDAVEGPSRNDQRPRAQAPSSDWSPSSTRAPLDRPAF